MQIGDWVGAVGGLLLLGGIALGQETNAPADSKAERSSSSKRFGFNVSLESRYDDNVLQLTASEIRSFNGNPSPGRFLIDSVDDRIAIGRASGRWTGRPFRRRETQLSAGLALYRFADDQVKDWQRYYVDLDQELSASKKHLTQLHFTLSYIPGFYLRQLTDEDGSFAAGHRIRRALDYSQQEWQLSIKQELVPKRLGAELGLERRSRDYNSFFNERDNDRELIRLRLEARPIAGYGLKFGIEYRVGKLDARGDLPFTPIADADISYDLSSLGAFASIPWGGRGHRGHLEVAWTPEKRDYSTGNKFEVRRFDTTANRDEWDLSITQQLWRHLDLVLAAMRLTSSVDSPPPFDLPADQTDFEQNTVSLGLRYRL